MKGCRHKSDSIDTKAFFARAANNRSAEKETHDCTRSYFNHKFPLNMKRALQMKTRYKRDILSFRGSRHVSAQNREFMAQRFFGP